MKILAENVELLNAYSQTGTVSLLGAP